MGSSVETESTKIELKTERLEKYTEDIDQLVSITRKSEREKMEAVMREQMRYIIICGYLGVG